MAPAAPSRTTRPRREQRVGRRDDGAGGAAADGCRQRRARAGSESRRQPRRCLARAGAVRLGTRRAEGERPQDSRRRRRRVGQALVTTHRRLRLGRRPAQREYATARSERLRRPCGRLDRLGRRGRARGPGPRRRGGGSGRHAAGRAAPALRPAGGRPRR